MTLRNLYLLRAFFRLSRLILVFFTVLNGAVVIIGALHQEFNRDLLIYAAWTALCVLLVIISTEAIKVLSKKIVNLS